jgi:cell division protein FtsI (penicillin-binding protein 3)
VGDFSASFDKYLLGRKMIVDEHKFKMLSAEDVIVHSSYIGIAQLAQRLKGKEFQEGLNRFGFAHFSGTDLPYEKRGSIPSTEKLDNYLYKAIVSYGYGVSSNTMQLLKAYNTFNNNGRMINPMVVNSLIDTNGKVERITNRDPIQVISPATAQRMKQILIKTVNEGTATIAKTKGLEVGGKTGVVHVAKNGKYLDSYNTSFVGFVNDAKNTYTIAIMAREPRTKYSPSISAVPVFKAIVDMMVEEKYLKK